MTWWLVGTIAVIFALSITRGAPWLPTKKKNIQDALRLLDLRPGQTLVDLGSGDGCLLLAAAKQDLRVIGYEINPILYIWSRIRTWRYRDKVKIVWGDYWLKSLPDCDGVYVFLIDHYMDKLEKKLGRDVHGSVRVVSYIFKLPNKTPDKEDGGMFLYLFNNT